MIRKLRSDMLYGVAKIKNNKFWDMVGTEMKVSRLKEISQ